MASKVDTAGLAVSSAGEQVPATSSLRFDWMMVIVSVWWLGGLFIDGWAHSNIPQLETFFTPWHAVLYSGYLAVAITLIVKILQNLRQDSLATGISLPALLRKSWLKGIPPGYELSLLGVLVFGVSGIGDMTWHLIFGIERGTEALLSPTHLGLAMGIGLTLGGPLRAAWRRREDTASWRQLGPAIFALTFTFSLLTFFTEYASPLIMPWPLIHQSSSPSRGITDILLSTVLMMGFVLLALRRWRLPFGTFTFLFGLNGALMAAFAPPLLIISFPTTLLGGLVADLLYRSLQPSPDQPASLHLFAFLLPLLLYILYFVDLAIVGPLIFHLDIFWSVPFWAGAPVIAGIAGFLLSYIIIPPAQADKENEKTGASREI